MHGHWKTAPFYVILCLPMVGMLCLLSCRPAPYCQASLGQTWEFAGVYNWGPARGFNSKEHPFLRGVSVIIHWSQLEPQNGQFDWSLFDEPLNAAIKQGFYIHFKVWVGQRCPAWLYDNGVPKVATGQGPYPYYFDEDYISYYYRCIQKIGEYFKSLPAEKRKWIVHYQVCEGSTGDEYCYKAAPTDSQYAISREDWSHFRIRAWQKFLEAFRSGDSPIVPLLFNPGPYTQEYDWIIANIPTIGIKEGMFSHGYQLNDGKDLYKLWHRHAFPQDANDIPIFFRGEMDREWITTGWFQTNPEMNFYWSALYGLAQGLVIWNVRNDAISTGRFVESFEFFNEFAGYKDPRTSPSAFIALRKGLDASDTRQFPENIFGEASRSNRSRFLAIADHFKEFGARQDDPEKALLDPMRSRAPKGLNDVFWNNLDSEYSLFISQIDADETSIGWWRVGPQDQVYGRYARGFQHSSGKDAMFFDIDDRFFGVNGLNGKYSVTVSVTWYDAGNGSWKLCYDKTGKTTGTAVEMTNTNTGRWRKISVEIPDAAFANGGARNSDLMLVNADAKDEIFHMIRIDRRQLK